MGSDCCSSSSRNWDEQIARYTTRGFNKTESNTTEGGRPPWDLLTDNIIFEYHCCSFFRSFSIETDIFSLFQNEPPNVVYIFVRRKLD